MRNSKQLFKTSERLYWEIRIRVRRCSLELPPWLIGCAGSTPRSKPQLLLTQRSEEDVAEVVQMMNQLTLEQLPEIGRQLDDLGIPWTPGRPVPAPTRGP